jgi:hypothetical protein
MIVRLLTTIPRPSPAVIGLADLNGRKWVGTCQLACGQQLRLLA